LIGRPAKELVGGEEHLAERRDPLGHQHDGRAAALDPPPCGRDRRKSEVIGERR